MPSRAPHFSSASRMLPTILLLFGLTMPRTVGAAFVYGLSSRYVLPRNGSFP